MYDIQMRCPKTQEWVLTSSTVGSKESYQSNSYVNCSSECTSCGKMHTWSAPGPNVRLVNSSPFVKE